MGKSSSATTCRQVGVNFDELVDDLICGGPESLELCRCNGITNRDESITMKEPRGSINFVGSTHLQPADSVSLAHSLPQCCDIRIVVGPRPLRATWIAVDQIAVLRRRFNLHLANRCIQSERVVV